VNCSIKETIDIVVNYSEGTGDDKELYLSLFLIEHFALKARRGAVVYLLVVLLSTKGGGEYYLHAPATLLPRKKHTDGVLGLSQCHSGCGEEDRNFCSHHYQELNPDIQTILAVT
jgi:hypothetical protein